MVLFVVLSGVPLIALGWLGWRLLQQDRALDAQRLRDRLDNSATALVREFERELVAWDDLLQQSSDGSAPEPRAGAVVVIFDANGVVQQHGTRLPYFPDVRFPQMSSAVFADAEADEFRRKDLESAARAYTRLTNNPSLPTRAAALVRLARVLRKQERHREALDVYASLAELGEITVAGSPAELVARRERMVLFSAMGNHAEAAREAAQLAAALGDGRFAIDRATFEFYHEAVIREGATGADLNARLALAGAMEAFWPGMRDKPSGRADWNGDSGAFIAVWRRTGTQSAALVGSTDALVAHVRRRASTVTERWSLEDSGGREISGQLPVTEIMLRKTFRETGLPWTIRMAAAGGPADRTFALRRNLFAASLGLMVLIIAASSYFVFGAVNRELRVARLQSDFVAAVSHEFRTPLTAMCHLTELLEEGQAPPGRVAQYHRALAKESRRLHAMVEGLLDFGRMEAGRRTYELADVDANSLVAEIVREFREQRTDDAPRVHLTPPHQSSDAPLMIRADRNALTVVLRNLLDNAIKYSPALGKVVVSVKPDGAFVGISVDDEGPGVSKAESQDIFRKFTRGAAARTMNVKGTGIGLTLAAEIVRAHGGRLEVDSEPGRGSRFTTFLPLLATHT